jgi:hypothetical protein
MFASAQEASSPKSGTALVSAGRAALNQYCVTCHNDKLRTAGLTLPCAKQILATLACRAYRRPVADADVQSLLALYQKGREKADFEAGIMRAVQGILVYPEFLFRVEREPANVAPGCAYKISDMSRC